MEQTRITQQRINYLPYEIGISIREFLLKAKFLFGNEIEVTRPFKEIMKNLILWVHNDEKSIYKRTNGIGLIGPTGTRKTFLMKCLQEYMKIDDVKYIRLNKVIPFNFKIFHSKDICGEFLNDGYDAINKYSAYNIICIDDLGTEPVETVHFGTRLNVIEALIEERYLAQKMTHFTSNLKKDEILNRYGDRVYSRLFETTNFIELIDKDFRLKN